MTSGIHVREVAGHPPHLESSNRNFVVPSALALATLHVVRSTHHTTHSVHSRCILLIRTNAHQTLRFRHPGLHCVVRLGPLPRQLDAGSLVHLELLNDNTTRRPSLPACDVPSSFAGAMPVLPSLLRAATAADADSRILDSRGLGDVVKRVAHSLSSVPRHVWRRAASILPRDNNDPLCRDGYIAACYQGLYSGPTAGAIVGIVLGSIAGFLLILWLLWILSNGTTFIRTTTLVEEDDVVVSRRRSRSPRSRRSHRSAYQAEMRHTHTHTHTRPERIIRQERIVREVPPPRAESTRVRETVIVEGSRQERRVDGDDIIEVVEEHSSIDADVPQPRRKSRRSSGYRSVNPAPDAGGYRRIDPELFAGGDYPKRRVR